MDDATNAFAKMVPGFDFLQSLVKNAGAAMPPAGAWVAPTLDPQELEKRIGELRTVQFWLEQNARMLGASIQAMEVQKMTLTTLKSMNVSFTDLTESLKMRMPTAAAAPPTPAAATPWGQAPAAASAAAAAAAAATASAAAAAAAAADSDADTSGATAPAPAAAPAATVDPLKWWGALTQQFTELATNAMKDSASAANAAAAAAAAAGAAGVPGAATAAAAPEADAGPAAAPARPRAGRRTAPKR
jgi:hypothetical protein